MTISNFKAALIMLGYKQLSLDLTFPLFNKSNEQFYSSNLNLLVNIVDKGDVDIYKVKNSDIHLLNKLYPDFDYTKSMNILIKKEK